MTIIFDAFSHILVTTQTNITLCFTLFFSIIGRLHILAVTTCGDTMCALPGVTVDERKLFSPKDENLMPILSSNSELNICDFHRSESHAFELQRRNFSYTRCPMVDPKWVDDLSEKLFDWIEDKVM